MKFTAHPSLQQGLFFEEGMAMVSPQNCEETQIAWVVHKDTRIKQNDCSSNTYLQVGGFIFSYFHPYLGKISNLTIFSDRLKAPTS